MSALGQVSNLIKGYTVPTTTTQKYTGPMPGAYAKSPAELLGGLTAGAGALFTPGSSGVAPYKGISEGIKDIGKILGITSNNTGVEDSAPAANTTNLQYAGTDDNGSPIYYDTDTLTYVNSSGEPTESQEGQTFF